VEVVTDREVNNTCPLILCSVQFHSWKLNLTWRLIILTPDSQLSPVSKPEVESVLEVNNTYP
jgi:hypothetical protein